MKSASPARHRRLALAVALLVPGLFAGSAISACTPAKPKQTFTISGQVDGLYPGAQRPAALRIRNKKRWEIVVRKVAVTVASTSNPGCPKSMVSSPGWAGSVRVAKGGTRVVSVPIRMSAAAPEACQGAVFALRYDGWGVRP